MSKNVWINKEEASVDRFAKNRLDEIEEEHSIPFDYWSRFGGEISEEAYDAIRKMEKDFDVHVMSDLDTDTQVSVYSHKMPSSGHSEDYYSLS